MKNNTYAVTVKFGHVGKNKYMVKTVPVYAHSGKEAAEFARWMPRVKHHAKDAVINVVEIDETEYSLLRTEFDKDPYFHCSSVQEQRENCLSIDDEVEYIDRDMDDELLKEKRKERIIFSKKKNKLFFKECVYSMRNYADMYV